MNILFDIAHPVDSHLYSVLTPLLMQEGHHLYWAGRDKDVSTSLIPEPYKPVLSTQPRSTRLGQALELVERIDKIRTYCKANHIDLILTRNPAGTLAARSLNLPSIYDTTDGKASGLHYYLACLSARWITCSENTDCFHSRKHLRYAANCHAAYLHPNHFQPNKNIKAQLHLKQNEPYFVLRFSAYEACHDHGHRGLSEEEKFWLVSELNKKGTVFISSEAPLPPSLQRHQLSVSANMFLDVLSEATAVIGDGISVAIEAALLGTPSLCISSYVTRLKYANDLAAQLPTLSLLPPSHSLKELVAELLGQTHTSTTAAEDFWSHQADLAEWYRDLIKKVEQGRI